MTKVGVNPRNGSNPAPQGMATVAELSWVSAVWKALLGDWSDFYPRIINDSKIESMDSVIVLREFDVETANLGKLTGSLDNALKLARQSLDEVKGQTEYQDQKATRLLTVTTFLTAFSGVLFTRFEDLFPLNSVSTLPWIGILLVYANYAVFGAFIIAALSGALIVFHATRTRFKYPSSELASNQDEDPNSLLFHEALIRVRPRAWMRAWVQNGQDGTTGPSSTLRSDLQERFLLSLIVETYLVAAKTADKLRFLHPAQSLLAASLRCLFVWLFLLAITNAAIQPPKSVPTPTDIRLLTPASFAIPVEIRNTPVQTPLTLTAPPQPPTTGHQSGPGGLSPP